ncbi:MAG: alpha/beta hydrolase [Chloroflexi bacterium]|nr:alpha/beta hydrolase [Chloroflexota bacterium]
MPQPDAESDLFAAVRARLPLEEQAEFDGFMKEYMNFNMLFQKSEVELVAMNEQFGKYYSEAIKIPMPAQGKEPGGWMVWAGYVSMGQRHDYRSALGNVNTPVLVIHGKNDLQSEAASRMYVEAFPNAQFVTIEDASHFSFEEQPEQFVHIVETFLENLK